MERVLVTGATGFIGKELTAKLIEKGFEVHTLERYVTGRYTLDSKDSVINHYTNLIDYNATKKAVKDAQPEYCIHLAATTALSFSWDHPIEVTETNYLGTVNLAEACRDIPHFKQFILAGTSEEYGTTLTKISQRLTEESPLTPNSPYSVAKVASDMYLLSYMRKAYGFPATVLRPFNTYGRRDNKHFFIERTITQMLDGKEVRLGDKAAVRDWLYVDDHVNGYIKALGNEKAIGEVIQLCTGVGHTIKETADAIARLIDFKGNIVWNYTQRRPLDAKILIGDNSKAKRLLGWEPRFTLEQGLKKTIEYWSKKEGVHRK